MLIALAGCRKEKNVAPKPPVPASSPAANPFAKNFDTIKPSDYWPVYPGSYWTYETNSGKTIISRADSSYKLDYFQYTGYNNSCVKSDTVYVPVVDANKIYGYRVRNPVSCNGPLEPVFTMYLPDNPVVGGKWSYQPSPKYTAVFNYEITKDTTLTINGRTYQDVLEVVEDLNGLRRTRRYYARNVGLVLWQSFVVGGQFPDSISYWQKLIDHKINRP